MRDCAGGVRVAHPLFQVEGDGSIPIPALSAKGLRIEGIPFELAKDLNRRWHSRLPRFGTGFVKNQPFPCFGAEYGGILYAVAIWSNPVARNLPQREWLELRRLATAPDAPRNTCSRMLRVMEILIRRARPEVVRLISYQDTEAHTGAIYKAAGWIEATLSEGDEWDRPGRSRPKAQSDAPKRRWEKALRETVPPAD
jgi:hypothetical protein